MHQLETSLYLIAILLQVAAVLFALRMARRSALRAPWFFMAGALSIMTLFRVVALLSSGRQPWVRLDEHEFRLLSAVASPIISLMLFYSLFAIRRLMRVQESAETARRAAEASLRQSELRLRAIFDQTFGFIALLAPDGTLLEVNKSPQVVTGFRREDQIGKPFWDADWFQGSAEVQRGLRAGIERAARGEQVRYESTYFTVDGAARTVDRSITPIHDEAGRVVNLIVEGHDITSRKRAEDALLHAKQEAESASAAKDQFLAVLSHELRTPLTPVLLLVSLMEGDADLPRRVRDEVGMIRRNVEMEARLIDDLLDLTRITRGKLQLNPEAADVHLLLRTAHDICCADGGPATTLRFEAARHHVLADPARVQQVFWNLLINAKKFTPADGRVEVVTSDVDGGRIRVEVRDTGAGIEPDLLPKVFNAFEQGDGTARRFGGLGLGLAICKALVEMHGGSIRAHSDGKGRGARFVVEMPTVPAPADVGGASPHGTSFPVTAGGPLRILLVEDHDVTSKVMQKLLSGLGHDVTAAGTARDAESAWQSGPFDLVISDLGLPDATGHELIERLRQHGPVRGIAVSGFGAADDLRRSTEAGFAVHVTKPLDVRRLKAAIHEAVEATPHNGGHA